MADLIRQVLTMLPGVAREPGTDLPPGAEAWEIDAAEARLGLPFPPELVAWLRVCNGPNIGEGGIYGVSHRPVRSQIEIHHAYLPGWCRGGYLPVAGDGCGGDYVIATRPTAGGLFPVSFVDHEDHDLGRPSYLVASGWWRFLWFLFRHDRGDRGWPCRRAYVLEHDPALAGVESARFCWDGTGG